MSKKIDTSYANIWITCKTRIQSEDRFRNYANWSHVIFPYYSLLLIITSLFSEPLAQHIHFFNELNIALSITLFTTSLVIHGFHFEDNANKHRECHIKLQALLAENLKADVMYKKYNEILSMYPNHAPIDYIRLVVKQTWFHKKKLWDTEDNEIKADRVMILEYFWHWLRFQGFIFLLILTPALLLTYPIWLPWLI